MNDAAEIQAYIDESVGIALSRLNFWEFCLYVDYDFFSKRLFLKKVADAFQTLYEQYSIGIAIVLTVSMPPRSGKSYITSLFCAWWLGKFPELSVMRNACTDRLYTKFSYDVRNIVKSDRYRKVFPHAVLAPDKQNVDGWNLTKAKQVSYFGGGVGGTIIGFGANLAISDDLYKDILDALSAGTQERVAQWKQSAHNSRMEKNCPEIFIGTRWTKNDEIGKAIEEGKVDVEITISALVVNEQGELVSFCEDVKSTAEYLKIKEETDEAIWDAEYMQEPAERKGLLFPKSELKYFRPDQITGEPEYKYMAVDPADLSDDTAAPVCKLYGSGIYITSVIYNNHGTDITIPAIVQKAISEQLNHVEIEGVGGWKLFGADVRNQVNEAYEDCEVRIIKNTTNKETRIQQFSAFVKNHFYFLHEDYWNSDYRKFMKVLTAYLREGKNKSDDACDAVTIAAQYFKRTFSHLF